VFIAKNMFEVEYNLSRHYGIVGTYWSIL